MSCMLTQCLLVGGIFSNRRFPLAIAACVSRLLFFRRKVLLYMAMFEEPFYIADVIICCSHWCMCEMIEECQKFEMEIHMCNIANPG